MDMGRRKEKWDALCFQVTSCTYNPPTSLSKMACGRVGTINDITQAITECWGRGSCPHWFPGRSSAFVAVDADGERVSAVCIPPLMPVSWKRTLEFAGNLITLATSGNMDDERSGIHIMISDEEANNFPSFSLSFFPSFFSFFTS